MTDAPDLLERAAKTMRERSVERDQEKERSMLRTVAAFNAQFGTSLSEYQGWMFMVHLKLARAEGGSFREDDYLDAAAYIALAGECRGNTTPELSTSEKVRRALEMSSGISDVSTSAFVINTDDYTRITSKV
jgi:hypothetical protein